MYKEKRTLQDVDNLGALCDKVNLLHVLFDDFYGRYFENILHEEDADYFIRSYDRIQTYVDHFQSMIYDIDMKISKLYLDVTEDESISNSQSIANLE